MKYIEYVNDWFSLYINPLDYEGHADQFYQHIFATLPFLDKMPQNAEIDALKEVITLNSKILMQFIEADEQQNASELFVTLKNQIILLKSKVKDYALNHFEALLQHDPFFVRLQDYINNNSIGLTSDEQKAIKESYTTLRLEELSLELTCQLAERDHIFDLSTQIEIDKIAIEIERYKFMGTTRSIILDSKQGTINLKTKIIENIMEFCSYIEKESMVRTKYDAHYIKRKAYKFVEDHFAKMQILEKISNENKVNELILPGLLLKEQHKHRSQGSLELVQQEIAITKQKIETAREIYANEQRKIEEDLIAFYQSIFRFSVDEKLQEVIKLFKIQNIISGDQQLNTFVDRAFSLLRLVSGVFERHLPSQSDLQIGAMGLTAGAFMIGSGPLGMVAGASVGIAAVKTHRAIYQATNRVSEELNALNQAWYGKFSVRYRHADYQVTNKLKQVCNNNTIKANIINAFYVRSIFNWDISLSCIPEAEQEEPEVLLIKKAKLQYENRYRQLRNGKIKSKDFWGKIFREDIAMKVAQLKHQIAIHTEAYIKSLYTSFSGHLNLDESQFHQRQMIGILDQLNEIESLHDHHGWSKLREHDTASYRLLAHTPLDWTFEDHVDQLMLHGSSAHLLFWLHEQAVSPREKFAEPLDRYQGKTLWHLLAEISNGDELMQKIMLVPKQPVDARWGTMLVKGLKMLLGKSPNTDLFDPSTEYQGMNPLAYAFAKRNVPLLRVYIEEVMQHPAAAQRIGIKTLFGFVAIQNPKMGELAAVHNHKVLQIFAGLFPNQASFELGLMAALTLCVAKDEPLPSSKEQWIAFLNELKHPTSAYIQVKALTHYDRKQISECAQQLAQLQLAYATKGSLMPTPLLNQDEIQSKSLLLKYKPQQVIQLNLRETETVSRVAVSRLC